MSGGETMRALLAASAGFTLLAACNTTDAPPPKKDVQATSATTSTTATASDLLASCRRRDGSNGAVTWTCPRDVGVVDIRSKHKDDAAELSKNLDLFALPMMGDAGKRDDAELVVGDKHYRSVKISGDVPGKGPIFARMIAIDSDPTRYVSCGAKTDACDDYIRALLARDAAAPKASAP
jgi:hypothetical protein